MSIVDVDALRAYMSSIGLDLEQEDSAQLILDGLQRQLERHCQRPLERKERTELVYPDELGRLWLTATPIISISDPPGLRPGQGNSVQGTYAFGLTTGYGFGVGYEPITVTYVGGISGEDEDDVRLAILRAAAREMTVRHDDVLGVSDLATRRVEPVDRRTPGFMPEELAKFDRLRRRTVA